MEYAYVYTYVSISLLQFNNNNEENDYARMALAHSIADVYGKYL